MGWITNKLSLTKKVFKSIDIEPFVFLYIMSLNASEVTRTQLIQDKICLNKYNQTREYCIDLGKNTANKDSDEIENKILGEVSQYLSYDTMVSNLPGIFYVLFIASWIDQYIHARKIVLCLGSMGFVGWYLLLILNTYKFDLNVIYVVLSAIPQVLVGGWSCVWMTIYSFMANHSSKEYRFIKFASFELASLTSRPLSIYIGGILLGSGNYHSNGNIHNYEKTFIFCLCTSTAAFLYLFIFINENKSKTKKSEDNKDINKNKIKSEKVDFILLNGKQMKTRFKFSEMFNINNLKDIFKTAIKVRSNKGRAKIWLLYISMCILFFTDAKFYSILFPYTEKVFGWDAQKFSDIKSLASIVQALAMPITSALLSTYFKISDSILGIYGMIIISLEDICMGSIVSPIGLYLLFIVGSTGSISALAIRSLLTKIAPESESGKIFALLGALELLFKSAEAVVLNGIFQFSINWMPSLLFCAATALNFIPIYIFFWIDFTETELLSTKL